MNNFKAITLFFILFFSLVSVKAQDRYEIIVESFNENISDMAGRLDLDQKTYQNKYAVLKIKTPNCNAEERSKFEIRADLGTRVIKANNQDIDEIRLYVETCLKQLIIKHPDFGEVVYRNDNNLKPLMVYEVIVMVTRPSFSGANLGDNIMSSNYVEINIFPKEIADKVKVMIDDEYFPIKVPFTPFLKTETEHHIVVEYDMYHTYEGTIFASKDEKKSFNITLSPAFGKINIVSLPESDAMVYIDGKYKGQTPYTSENLASGEHEVELVKELYFPLQKTVKVIDGNTSKIELTMKPNFGKVMVSPVTADDNVSIFVDNEFKSKGVWNGRLTPGEHKVEARIENHRSTSKVVTINIGEEKNIKIDNPIPIFGSANITSTPSGADIYLDGKKIGTTPYFTKLLIGSHELELKKEKYEDEKLTISVQEGETTSKSVTMQEEKAIVNSAEFSVSKDMKVVFSPGNLQYQASTKQWRFAEKQWDYVGEDNKNISDTYSGWIDLFGWGTGNNPTKYSKYNNDYSSFKDWGDYCGLSTPAGTTGKWRILTKDEWKYVMFERSTTSGVRYAKAKVNGVNGIIVVPDSWCKDIYSLNNTDDDDADFEVNVISASTWENILEPAGCVLLPAAGDRYGSSVYNVGSRGFYWSSTPLGSGDADRLYFSSDECSVDDYYRTYGRSVRLVAVPQN